MRVHYFDEVAYDYTTKVTPNRYAHYSTLRFELHLRGDERVLDIGCGSGILSVRTARKVPRGSLVGIDLSEKMIGLARQLARQKGLTNARFMVGDAMSLPFDNDIFDVVMSSFVFPWVIDQRRFMTEAIRVLKPHGRLGLLIQSPSVYKEFAQALRHTSQRHPKLLPIGRSAMGYLGARLHDIKQIEKAASQVGLRVYQRFLLTEQDPVTPQEYLTRITAIVGEDYLKSLTEEQKEMIRKDLFLYLARRNGALNFTESAYIVLAEKS